MNDKNLAYFSNDTDLADGNIGQPKNKMESEMVFKRSLDMYNVSTKSFVRSSKPPYATTWKGGCPMLCHPHKNTVYYDPSDAHTMILGATGSKKSRLLVMPTVHLLADAGESMVINDPKGEIYRRTSGHLEKNGYQLFVLNLRDPRLGNSWNPLSIPYDFYVRGSIDKANELVNDIANNLALSHISQKDPFWDYSAGNVLAGLILLLFKFCHENGVDRSLVNFESLWLLRLAFFDDHEYRVGSELEQLAKEDTVIYSSLSGTLTAADKTKASILCTLDEKIRFLSMSHELMGMLSDNDFDITSIQKQKSAVFLIVPDEKTTYHKLVSMFIKQSYECLVGNAYSARSFEDSALRVNYILDEFSALPAMQDFPSMIAAARSRNIRYILVVQSLHQLQVRYDDEAQTIMANCTNWFFLASRELQLLKNISELCGTDSKGKPLIPISTLQRLDKETGECLILTGRLRPYVSKLMDVDAYDQGNTSTVPFRERARDEKKRISFQAVLNKNSDSKTNRVLEKPNWNANHQADDDIDLSAALEKKFDELFGKLDSEANEEDDTDD